ncbi:hypothetical protein [Hymenobacter canadensis]|uniref:Uncharacterized protein n=1 Tax=Hymenobacter canadensis TaxID=2999067 RepID=A0ABY7LV12_9BACT|nr:hypothetical protein [Hymenobacter canadensis]WBA44224.1 hypothetical protein O3303_20260 [Hymenobacter canadensis]
MPLSTLLLDPDYSGFFQFIVIAPCLVLAALELLFTLLYFNKRKPVFLFLFLLPTAATVLLSFMLFESHEAYDHSVGVCSFVFALLLLAANVREMFRK